MRATDPLTGRAPARAVAGLGVMILAAACSAPTTPPRVPPERARYPSDLLPALSAWKLTLPVDAQGADSSDARSVAERNRAAHEVVDLLGYACPPYFTTDGVEVVFRAHVAGATTRGSKYPRSELRQRVGGSDGYWSVEARQVLDVELRVTHVPVAKPEVCMVQIHGPRGEPLRVQYHAGVGVYLVWNEDHKDTDRALAYALGERLRVHVEVDRGRITTRVENLDRGLHLNMTWVPSERTGYFKVGCYTQSARFLAGFKSGYGPEDPEAYGEVRVSRLEVVETPP